VACAACASSLTTQDLMNEWRFDEIPTLTVGAKVLGFDAPVLVGVTARICAEFPG